MIKIFAKILTALLFTNFNSCVSIALENGSSDLHHAKNANKSTPHLYLPTFIDYLIEQFDNSIEKECINHVSISNNNTWNCEVLQLNDESEEGSSVNCFCHHDYECLERDNFYLSEMSSIESQDRDYFNYDDRNEYDAKKVNHLCEDNINESTHETSWTCDYQLKKNYQKNYDSVVPEEIFCKCKRLKLCKFNRIVNLMTL